MSEDLKIRLKINVCGGRHLRDYGKPSLQSRDGHGQRGQGPDDMVGSSALNGEIVGMLKSMT